MVGVNVVAMNIAPSIQLHSLCIMMVATITMISNIITKCPFFYIMWER